MSLNFRMRTILGKVESSYGVDPVPTGASDAILCGQISFKPMANENLQREIVQPWLGQKETIPVSTVCDFEFGVELQSSGAAGTAPQWGTLLKACGFSETVTPVTDVQYAPASSGHSSIAFYFNQSGIRHKLLGCRGNVRIMMTPRRIPYLMFSFKGLYGGVSDQSHPSQTLTAWKAPLAMNNANSGSFALHGYSGLLYDMQIDMKNQVVHRNLVGIEDVLITDRAPDGNIVIEAPAIATKDFFTVAAAGTQGTLTLTHGTVAGYKVLISGSYIQPQNPEYEDRDGIVALKMPLRFMPGAAGNDELTIKAF